MSSTNYQQMADSDQGQAGPRGPVDPLRVPRFTGPPTFARLPRIDEVDTFDVAVVGVPFDTGTSYRPGARFGPQAVRQGSRLLRGYHVGLDAYPFGLQQVVDAGDLACNPFDILTAISEIEAGASELLADGGRLVSIGGDHTIALPLLRAVTEHSGPVALLHFDAHPDTLNTQHGGQYTHGTPFRRAVEEGLLLDDQSMHVGIRGSVFARSDLDEDADMGFRIVSSMDVAHDGVEATIRQIRDRIGNAPLYISIDIDVLDPAHAPGTGTPEAGGLTSRELLAILRGMVGLRIASADVVEVAPAYDHAEITTIAAAHVIYELVTLMGLEDVQGGTARGD